MTYHVVCHDCTLEEVAESWTAADQLVADHAVETGHDVEYAEVA